MKFGVSIVCFVVFMLFAWGVDAIATVPLTLKHFMPSDTTQIDTVRAHATQRTKLRRRDTMQLRDGRAVVASRPIFNLDSLADVIYVDTLKHNYLVDDTSYNRKKLSNLIVNTFFKTVKEEVPLDKVTKFDDYSSRAIDSIVIVSHNIFYDSGLRSVTSSGGDNFASKARLFVDNIHQTANKLNVVTKEATIRRYLMFAEGDTISTRVMTQNEAVLRDMSSLSQANIRVDTAAGRTTVFVETIDSWNLSAQFYYRRINNSMLRISDYDFMGTGNRLDVNEYFNFAQREWFKATELAYFMPNVFGKFIEVYAGGGYGNKFHSLFFNADKYFVKPNDWAAGVRYDRKREEKYINYEYIFHLQDKQDITLWFGQSINISPRWGDNFFYSFKVNETKFFERPYQSSTYNSYFHNSRDVLMSVGFYKEKFYRGNRIYDFGKTENIPYGYKVELIGGYRYGEYDTAPYVGTRLSIGNAINIGYVSASINAGTFLGDASSLRATVVDADVLYFTRLYALNTGYFLRQFLTLSYKSNIKTVAGYASELEFDNSNILRRASDDAHGTTLLQLNPETVLFTPMRISGFQFTLFGFTDLGTLGYSDNPFKNNFFAVMGAGVRVRNESMIFKTIQFRIAFALKGSSQFRNNLFYFDSTTPLRVNSFVPEEPEIITTYE